MIRRKNMQILKHESSYYQTTGFKWKQRIGFGISDYACNLAYLLANTYLLFLMQLFLLLHGANLLLKALLYSFYLHYFFLYQN